MFYGNLSSRGDSCRVRKTPAGGISWIYLGGKQSPGAHKSAGTIEQIGRGKTNNIMGGSDTLIPRIHAINLTIGAFVGVGKARGGGRGVGSPPPCRGYVDTNQTRQGSPLAQVINVCQ